jgi:nicotinate phosphoribosyltransferase
MGLHEPGVAQPWHAPRAPARDTDRVESSLPRKESKAMIDHSTLLTDLYELTMAYGFWKNGMVDREAVFHVAFRQNPFGSGFTVAAGLAPAIGFLSSFGFADEDLDYLGSLRGADGAALFEEDFLRFLKDLRFDCDVDAVPEGTVVFANEPLLRVRGPLLPAQLVETALLNILNFQTLIATKAARVCLAAEGDEVLEFGLRRAQGIDGGLAATRAAYVGGVHATSNVLAGFDLGIPIRGTHAHSWVMAFDDELESFEAYARAMPNNCVFLVDTYDSLQGVRHAVEIGRRLRDRGHALLGIRLDSGDLAYLSREARRLLDEGGFRDARIVASNDLDETIITSLKQQGARIDVWGVGTRLVTGWGQPALGGVYKLSAIREKDGAWQHRLKVSEQTAKISMPGMLQVRRFTDGEFFAGDMLFDELSGRSGERTIVDPLDPLRQKTFADDHGCEELLVPVMRAGQPVYDTPPLSASRERTAEQLRRLHPGIRRFVNPHIYPVGLDRPLYDLRMKMILEARSRR